MISLEGEGWESKSPVYSFSLEAQGKLHLSTPLATGLLEPVVQVLLHNQSTSVLVFVAGEPCTHCETEPKYV